MIRLRSFCYIVRIFIKYISKFQIIYFPNMTGFNFFFYCTDDF